MSSFDLNSLAKQTNDHLNTYIKLADQKASILLTGQLAFLGLAATVIVDILSETTTEFHLLAGLGAACGLGGMLFAGSVIFPRTPKANEGYIFWEHILEHDSREEFQDRFSELSGSETLDELVKENYALAKVAHRKYRHLRISLAATAGMIIFATISTGVYLT